MSETEQSYKYFKNEKCKYFPCHETQELDFNCLFCYCPLYFLGNECGGDFMYEDKIKNCADCCLPHRPDYYETVIAKIKTRLKKQRDETGERG